MRYTAIFLTFALCLAAPSVADTIFVPSGSAPTIQFAIEIADPNDEIVLADGVYTGPGNVGVNFNGKRLTLRSASGDPNACVLDANGGPGIFMVSGESGATLDGIRLQNFGLGLKTVNSSPIVRRCVFSNGGTPVGCGGGFCKLGMWPRFYDCKFIDYSTVVDARGVAQTFERCEFRGADNIGVFLAGSCVFRQCRFSDNEAQVLLRLSSDSTSALITDCVFERNVAGSQLISLLSGNARIAVHRSWFLDNSFNELTSGGGGTASWEFDHCVFARNSTLGFTIQGNVTLSSSIFVRNGRSHLPPMLRFGGPNQRAALRNCIYWNNDWIAVARPAESVQYSIVDGGWPDVGNIDADPMFVDPNNNDFRLLPGSPAIDAGTIDLPTDICPQVDLGLHARVFDDPNTPNTGFGGPIDMGAYEFRAPFRGGAPPCLADLTGDQIVGLSDLALLLSSFAVDAEGDLTCDGTTDLADLSVLLSYYGHGCE